MKITKKILKQELKDDNTLTGGISHDGETVRDFINTVNINTKELTLERLNEALRECGIMEIKN